MTCYFRKKPFKYVGARGNRGRIIYQKNKKRKVYNSPFVAATLPTVRVNSQRSCTTPKQNHLPPSIYVSTFDLCTKREIFYI